MKYIEKKNGKVTQEGSDWAYALAINSVNLSAITQSHVAGVIKARSLDLTNLNKLDSVLGASDLHIDIGSDTAVKVMFGKYTYKSDGSHMTDENGKKTYERAKLGNVRENLKNFLQWGNVAKNGVGGGLEYRHHN